MLRRVQGTSMLPYLQPNQLVVGMRWLRIRRLRPGHVVILKHNGFEKVKRVDRIQGNQIFVVGDNPTASTDSRHFGWLPFAAVQARVIWPRTPRQ